MSKDITPIKESDFEELIRLITEFSVFEKLPEKMTNTLDQMKQEEDFIKGFVVRDNGKIVAYVTFFFAYYTWVGKSLYMDDLYVTQDYRGRGLGTLLIENVKRFAKDNGCKKLRWQVSDWNKPAIGFYKSLGAEIDEVEMNCDLML